jgi:hypothetical protein
VSCRLLEEFSIKEFQEEYVGKQILDRIVYAKVFVAGNMNE